MSETPVIFISHASEDKEIAIKLKKDIEKVWTEESKYFSQVEVFVSTDPAAISIGQDWHNTVIAKLQKAQIFIVLLAKNSLNRPWVWFEIGFFWNKKVTGEKVNIFPLYEAGVEIPSPLNVIQGKCLSDSANMAMFWTTLGGVVTAILLLKS